jgi:N-acetylglucosaminyl-diphospho-decaprenol L-rhamnosyltransferase
MPDGAGEDPADRVPRVRVVVLNYNGGDHVLRCLDALIRTDWPASALELVVVDNASTDGSVERIVKEHPEVTILATGANLGFPANNLALRDLSSVSYVALVNNDAFVEPGWLAPLVAEMEGDGRVGAANSLVLFDDRAIDTINNAGNEVLTSGYGRDRGFGSTDLAAYADAVDVFAWCGAAVLLRPAYLADVGLFDEQFFLYYEDTDLSWRGQLRGWRYRFVPESRVRHLHSATIGAGSDRHRFYAERNRLVMLVKDAPRDVAWRAVWRFPMSTLSYARRGDLHAVKLRCRSYWSFLTMLPHALRGRHRVRSRSTAADTDIVGRLVPDPNW